MDDAMRGLFFIVKGQHKRNVKPCFTNKLTQEINYIGGYDPHNEDTVEWYQLVDCKTFQCLACGSDLNKVLNGVYNIIMRYKGVARNYFKHISDTTSDDYYETHYLGHAPLGHEQRANKAEGRCPRTSPIMREVYRHIYEEFGDYFSDEVKEKEDLAYKDLKEKGKGVLNKPKDKARKLVTKNRLKPKDKVETADTLGKVVDTSDTKLKKAKPKLRVGIKKL